ncbi:MAG: FG-GAP repeat domain-containing protein, partial [Spirochaetota bacterium]
VAYISEIRYTGNADTGMIPCQYVRFSYTDRDDAYVSKSAGFIMRMDRLVDTITVGWSDPRGYSDKDLWSYTLVYEDSEDSHRPLLSTVKSSRHTSLPEFIYQDAVHNFVWQNASNPWAADSECDPKKTKYFEGDFNGDGISDMVFFNPETGEWKAAEGKREGGYTFKVYGSAYQGYRSADRIQFFKGNVTGDYNGDGRSDIAFYLTETREFVVAEHNGKVFSFVKYGTLPTAIPDIFACEWFSGDYDGNGLSDALLFYEPEGAWYLMCNTGGAFSFTKVSEHFKNLYRDDYAADMNLDSASTLDTTQFGRDREKVHFLGGDFNGDGRSDVSIYDARSGKWYVGSHSRDAQNGFIITWKLYREFTAPEAALFANDRFSGDFDGNGFSDFLMLDRDSGKWILGETGEDTIRFITWSALPSAVKAEDITRWLQGDFNGDGRTDVGFYCKSDGNFWVGEATPSGFRYRIYNNMSYGPDADTVLGSAPLPHNDVTLEQGKAYVATSPVTAITYQFNANAYKGYGEQVFAGSFSAEGKAELLVYKGKEDQFYIQKSDSSLNAVGSTSSDLDTDGVVILNGGKAGRFGEDADGIAYIVPSSSGYEIKRAGANGVKSIGMIASNKSFDPKKSIYAVGGFGGDAAAVLVCNDEIDDAAGRFTIYRRKKAETGDGIVVNLRVEGLDDSYFQNLRAKKENIRLIVTGGGDFVLVDMSTSPQSWYRGVIDAAGNKITFSTIEQHPVFAKNGIYDAF